MPVVSSSFARSRGGMRIVMRPVFPGQRLVRLEFLQRRMYPPRLREDIGQCKRADGGACALRRHRGNLQRLPAGCFRRARKILGHDADARPLDRGAGQSVRAGW